MSVLGFLDEELTLRSKAHHTSTYVGGEPLFPPSCPPDHTAIHCQECGTLLQLALQAYSPVVDQQDRTLYLFFCGFCAAPTSWKCLRSVHWNQPKMNKPRKKKGNKQGNKQGASNAFSFTSPSEPSSSGNPFEATDSWDVSSSWDTPEPTTSEQTTTSDLEELLRLRDLSLQEKSSAPPASKKNKKKQRKVTTSETQTEGTANTNAMQPTESESSTQDSPVQAVSEQEEDHFQNTAMWIYVEEEPESIQTTEQPSQRPLSSIDGADAEETAQWSGEKYERNTAYTKNFSRFLKYTQRAPQQILRYSLGGDALWVTNRDMPKISPCDACGAPRMFELQLMPHGLNWVGANLIKADTFDPTLRLAGCGSVFVFSCSAFCDGDPLREELVVTQETEDNSTAQATKSSATEK